MPNAIRSFLILHGWSRQEYDTLTDGFGAAIFYHDDEQKRAAEQMKEIADRSGKWRGKVVTEIVPVHSAVAIFNAASVRGP